MDDFTFDPMWGARMFDEDTWNDCIKLIKGSTPLELNLEFEQAAVNLGKFRDIIIENLERHKDLDALNMDEVLDWINKSKALEKKFREAAKRINKRSE